MAGAGYKLFNTGDVLTAAQVNTYLMEQTVMVFANAAARTTALSGVVSEGMISYLKDTNAVEVYDGSNWVSSDDPNAIQNTIVDAKGDLIAASAADTPARLAVGNNGETLVADSSTSTGLRWQGSQAAGRNLLVNGAMDYWQRGTSSTTSGTYIADRWYHSIDGATTGTVSQQTTSLPSGFRYSMRLQRTNGNTGTGGVSVAQILETSTSIPLQGQTATFSFWAKVGANFSASPGILQIRVGYGTGTDQSASSAFGGWTGYSETAASITPTTSWARYSINASVPSNATQISVRIFYVPSGTAGANDWFEVTGIQLEQGSVATPFTRAGGTLAGELAACQRYLPSYDNSASSNNGWVNGYAYATNNSIFIVPFPVTARVNPTGVTVSGTINAYALNTATSVTPTFDAAGTQSAAILASHTITAGQGARMGITSGAKLLFTGCEL